MSRPTTKPDLLHEADARFATLWALIETIPPELQEAPFRFDDRDKNLRDVLIHLHEWHLMVQRWHKTGTLEGGLPDVPGTGYTWKTLPALNQEIWRQYQHVPLDEAERLLRQSHKMILGLIDSHTNDQLFAKGVYKWTKSSTLGAYFVSCTASHYDWAMTKLKKAIKAWAG